jgi:hypothetical protein
MQGGIMKRSIFGIVALTALLSTACGKTVTVEPPQVAYKGPNANGIPITLAAVTDDRDDKSSVGLAMGWFNVKVHASTDSDVAQAFSTTLKTTLKKAGFEIVPESEGAPVLKVSITKLVGQPISHLMSNEAVAEVVVRARINVGGKLYAREFVGHGQKAVTLFLSSDLTDAFGSAMAAASQEIATGCLQLAQPSDVEGESR